MNVTHAQLVNLEQSLSELVIEERQLQSFYATDLIKKLIYHVSDVQCKKTGSYSYRNGGRFKG